MRAWRYGERRSVIMMKKKALGIAAAVFAASSLLAAGCGGKTAERIPAPGALQGPRDAQDVITDESIAAVKKGMSVGEVAAVFGQEGVLVGRSIVNGVYSYTYRWQDGGNKMVDATFSRENLLNNPLSQLSLVEAEINMSTPIAQRAVK